MQDNINNTSIEEENGQQHTEYAVRPEHRRHRRISYSDRDNMLKTRNYLNIAFMVLAVAGVIIWTQMKEHHTLATIVLLVAVAIKIAEVCIRLFKK